MAENARREKPSTKLVVENVENIAHFLLGDDDNEPVHYRAQWVDDIHYVLDYLVTGEQRNGYDDKSRDPTADREKGLRDGFIHDGEADGKSDGRTGGEPGSDLPPEAFMGFVQNHDQIGNRPDGKRLADRISAEKLDFVHFVSMLAPHLPLFFMGEEAHLRSAFSFFVDLEKVALRSGRARADIPDALPDSSDPDTFERSKLS